MRSFAVWTVLCMSLLIGPSVIGQAPQRSHNQGLRSAHDMRRAADLFLKTLDEKQRAQAQFKFSDAKRTKWSYLPDKFIKPDGRRYGLPIEAMNHQQRLFAYGLVNSALSNRGALTVNTIMALEQVLHELENGNPIRNTQRYYVSIFGTPSESETWSWRFEGHHVSINVTLVDGQRLSVTPSFFGSNPGHVTSGPLKGLRALGAEELLARGLAKSLKPNQLKQALILKDAPADIYSKDQAKVDPAVFDLSKGIAYSDLEEAQQRRLLTIVGLYVRKFRPDLVAHLKQSPLSETETMVFAWAGSLEPKQGHYYRIVTKNHLIEYDNVQNGANHPHCVWRVLHGDFGEDLLRKHHLQEH